jgi:predicted nucleic acid-binding protein
MAIVVDTSVSLAWVLPDERNELTEAILSTVAAEGMVVPVVWNYEMANGLVQSTRRGRLTREQKDEALQLLGMIPTVAIPRDELADLVATADDTGLTGYDAAYISLAERERLALATLDRRMRDAAAVRGIEVLP